MKKLLQTLPLMALAAGTPVLGHEFHTSRAGRAEHIEIIRELDRIGITFLVNEPEYCNNDHLGVYYPYRSTVVICQEQAIMWNGSPVRFTAEDLDTVRHEAMHVAQDCKDGHMTGSLDVLTPQDDLIELVARFGVDKMKRIIAEYEAGGAPPDIQLAEIEAWAVSAEVPAQYVVESLRFYCR